MKFFRQKLYIITACLWITSVLMSQSSNDVTIETASTTANNFGAYNTDSQATPADGVEGGIRIDYVNGTLNNFYRVSLSVNGGTFYGINSNEASLGGGSFQITSTGTYNASGGVYIPHNDLASMFNWPSTDDDLADSRIEIKLEDITDQSNVIVIKSVEFNLDLVKPTVSSATVETDNALNGTGNSDHDGVNFYAKAGDNVKLIFTASENLQTPTGNIAGVDNFNTQTSNNKISLISRHSVS